MRIIIISSTLLLLSILSMLKSPTAFLTKPKDVYLTCTCPKETPPEPKKLYKEEQPNYEFSWISDADKIEERHWCYFRGFRNLHEKNIVSVDFKEAEIRADVPPGGQLINKVENETSNVEPISEYDLYYTPSRSPKALAGLIKPQVQSQTAIVTTAGGPRTRPVLEMDTSKPIVTEIRYDVRDPEKKNDYNIAVTLSSSTEREGDQNRYAFSMVNQGKDTLRFQWETVEKAYDADAMKVLITTFQGKSTEEPGVELEPGRPFEITAPSRRAATIIPGVIKIYRNNIFLASGFAPAFLPRVR
jgi:hypothetical protein